MSVKQTLMAAAILMVTSFTAHAATITGQLDINGLVDHSTSDFSAGGQVNFLDFTPSDSDPVQNASVGLATNDFDTFLDVGDDVQMTNIDFSNLGVIYLTGGFEFTATAIKEFFTVSNFVGATLLGTLTHASFDDTDGIFTITSQGGGNTQATFSSTTVVPLPASLLLLLTGLLGLGFLGRTRTRTPEAAA